MRFIFARLRSRMDTIKGIISDLHVFLYGGMRTLPLTLAGTMIIVGLFTANYAMMFCLVGLIIVTPILAWVMNMGADALGAMGIKLFAVKSSDVCSLIIPYSTLQNPSKVEDISIFCTTSHAMVSFFIGYILTNAVRLYATPPPDQADPIKVSNRKSHAVMAIASIVVFALIAIGFRSYTGCEPTLGLILGTLLFGGLGVGWYYALGQPMEGRLADIFGIANRIIPSSATSMACVPTA